ncbi:MAG: ThuA domain-containing protein, partial [Tunicatimonas sp.]|uniref:ThuA domain-containing protein n=1 Tax=Tunicatimonas sp. TaxID=1940096 RepID=UPI003C71A8E9
VFLNTTGEVLDFAQQRALRRYMQAGGGFMGIHGASGALYSSPWYGKLLGARFASHPPELQSADVYVANQQHPALQHVPLPWKHTEEWYNFQDISPKINVLATVNESSYQGGEHGDHHPVIWNQPFEGGRSFYTALGHRPEAYLDSTFVAHVLGGIEYVIGDNASLDYQRATALPVPPEAHCRQTVLLDSSQVAEPMELAVAPDGRVFYAERQGKVQVYDPATQRASVIGTIPVYSKYEDGLLGITLDPDFAQNQWLYVFYSAPGDAFSYHLSRFTLNRDGLLDFATEEILLKVPQEHSESNHTGGSLAFGPDGNLFVAIGDNTNPFGDSKGYAPIDERPGREDFDAQRSSGNTQDLRGKILRIRPARQGDAEPYTIPEGNLFSDETEGRPEIYVMGTRNSFRISVDPANGWLYWGDVGPDAGQDSIQGPRGYDEINQAQRAGNFGWPYFVGPNRPYADVDFATGAIGSTFDPSEPVNASPRNTGARVLPPAQPAFLYYPYLSSERFPVLGSGGRSAMAGPVYHYNSDLVSDVKLPAYFDRGVFVYDWMRNWIVVVRTDAEGNYVGTEPFMANTDFSKIIDLEMGPDGALYLLEYGKNWYAPNQDAQLSRITYHQDTTSLPEAVPPPLAEGAAPSAAGHQANATELGAQLISTSDCEACHAMDQKSVGPSFRAIAARYEADSAVVAQLTQKIINGGGGVWGPNYMSAHPQLSPAEAQSMVTYILGLH